MMMIMRLLMNDVGVVKYYDDHDDGGENKDDSKNDRHISIPYPVGTR